MDSWQNSHEPLIISIRCNSTPGCRIFTMNTLEAQVLGHVPVRAQQAQAVIRDHAPVVHTFDPFTAHSSPSRTASSRRCRATSNAPPLARKRNCIQIFSPLSMAGTWRRFCASVPNFEQHGHARRSDRSSSTGPTPGPAPATPTSPAHPTPSHPRRPTAARADNPSRPRTPPPRPGLTPSAHATTRSTWPPPERTVSVAAPFVRSIRRSVRPLVRIDTDHQHPLLASSHRLEGHGGTPDFKGLVLPHLF